MSADEELVRHFFLRLHGLIQASPHSGEEQRILFVIHGKWSAWLIKSKTGVEEIKQDCISSIATADCKITTDPTTFLSLIRGQCKPLIAVMNGNLKIEGDRRAFMSLASLIKKTYESNFSMTSKFENRFEITIGKYFLLMDNNTQYTSYEIRVTDNSNSVTWIVYHRYSDFVHLRKKLIKCGNINLPPLENRGRLSKLLSASAGQAMKLINNRMKSLTTFLKDLLDVVTQDIESVIHFLHIDEHCPDHMKGAVVTPSAKEAFRRHAEEVVLAHAAKPIRWDSTNKAKSMALLSELSDLRRNVDSISDSQHKNYESVFSFSVLLHAILYVTVFICARFVIVDMFAHPSSIDGPSVVNCHENHFLHSSLTSSVLTHLTYLSIPFFLGLEMARVPLILSSLLVFSFQSYQMESNYFHTISQQFYSAVTCFITTVFSATWPSLLSFIFLVSTAICLFLLGRLFSRYKRMIFINLIFVIVMGSYLSVRVLCGIFPISPPIKDHLYELVHRLLAPFIAHQMGYLRSMFVKFSQAIGSRADVVPPTWSKAMSRLHDACPPSPEYHVRASIEEEFGLLSTVSSSTSVSTSTSTSLPSSTTSVAGEKSADVSTPKRLTIEDIFETFDMTPLASASIGQVHNATVRLGEKVVSVVVKVQHRDVARIMREDMEQAAVLANIAAWFDNRWQVLVVALRGWRSTMADELDFRIEADNLDLVGSSLLSTGFDVQVPVPVRCWGAAGASLVSRTVFVMTKLDGFKVTDKAALNVLGVDRAALVSRITHCCARQLLVDGVFNADPHAGNLMFVTSASNEDCCCPGLLDFGMTVRLGEGRRLSYCRLISALYEGDVAAVSVALREVGYATTQSDRVPERDAEFFEFLFRDASPRKEALKETISHFDKRRAQMNSDKTAGTRERLGRQISSLPDDLIFLVRVAGLLRGLTAELGVHCPILHILALHAQVGLYTANQTDGTQNQRLYQ